MNKKLRSEMIYNLIEEFEIDTQEELTQKLNERGYNVSQATVSRDISDLNIIKTSGLKKKFKYVKANVKSSEIPQKIIDIFKSVVISIESAGNLIVVKSLAGNAGTLGMAVDAMKIPQILGTIAGDDTLLIISKTLSDADIILKTLRNI